MVLNSNRKTRKKALADRQGCQSRERLVERPWLQLICCAPVFSHEVSCIFWSKESHQDKSPKWASEGVRENKIQLELVDINLQTEKYYIIVKFPEYDITTI